MPSTSPPDSSPHPVLDPDEPQPEAKQDSNQHVDSRSLTRKRSSAANHNQIHPDHHHHPNSKPKPDPNPDPDLDADLNPNPLHFSSDPNPDPELQPLSDPQRLRRLSSHPVHAAKQQQEKQEDEEDPLRFSALCPRLSSYFSPYLQRLSSLWSSFISFLLSSFPFLHRRVIPSLLSLHSRYLSSLLRHHSLILCIYTFLSLFLLSFLFYFHGFASTSWPSIPKSNRPMLVSCHDTFWLAGNGCGVGAADCQPFEETQETLIRCAARCDYIAVDGLAIGGGDKESMKQGRHVYRSDSHVCFAAIHAGLADSNGGCLTVRLSGPQHSFPTVSPSHGIKSASYDSWFPSSFQLSSLSASSSSSSFSPSYCKYMGYDILGTLFLLFFFGCLLRPPFLLFWYWLMLSVFCYVSFTMDDQNTQIDIVLLVQQRSFLLVTMYWFIGKWIAEPTLTAPSLPPPHSHSLHQQRSHRLSHPRRKSGLSRPPSHRELQESGGQRLSEMYLSLPSGSPSPSPDPASPSPLLDGAASAMMLSSPPVPQSPFAVQLQPLSASVPSASASSSASSSVSSNSASSPSVSADLLDSSRVEAAPSERGAGVEEEKRGGKEAGEVGPRMRAGVPSASSSANPTFPPLLSPLSMYFLYVCPCLLFSHFGYLSLILPNIDLTSSFFDHGVSGAITIAIGLVLMALLLWYLGLLVYKSGLARLYLKCYGAIIALIILVCLLFSPSYSFHLHHELAPLFVLPLTRFPNRPLCLLIQSACLGISLNGFGVWGWAADFDLRPGADSSGNSGGLGKTVPEQLMVVGNVSSEAVRLMWRRPWKNESEAIGTSLSMNGVEIWHRGFEEIVSYEVVNQVQIMQQVTPAMLDANEMSMQTKEFTAFASSPPSSSSSTSSSLAPSSSTALQQVNLQHLLRNPSSRSLSTTRNHLPELIRSEKARRVVSSRQPLVSFSLASLFSSPSTTVASPTLSMPSSSLAANFTPSDPDAMSLTVGGLLPNQSYHFTLSYIFQYGSLGSPASRTIRTLPFRNQTNSTDSSSSTGMASNYQPSTVISTTDTNTETQ